MRRLEALEQVMRLRLKCSLRAADGSGVLAQVLVRQPDLQPELQPEGGEWALPEEVVERPHAAEPGDDDSEVHRGGFSLISLILIGP